MHCGCNDVPRKALTKASLTPHTAVWPHIGNNAVEMETTATFDKEADEFIINTPTTVAQKYWITNSAVHAKWSAVFAQLLIDGTNHGIHGFLVRIRNEVSLPCWLLACVSPT